MTRNFLLATTCVILGATSASALDFTGGTVGAEYVMYPDVSEVSELQFSAQVEFAVNPAFSLAFDVSNNSFDIDGSPASYSSSSALIHAIYHVSDTTNVGGYVAHNNVFYFDATSFGVEASYDGGAYDVSGYLGVMDFPLADEYFKTVGVAGGYDFGNGFGMTASFDLFYADDVDENIITSRLGGDYDFGNGISVFAEVGHYSRSEGGGSDLDTFVTIGSEISFGPNSGTTFDGPPLFDYFALSGI
jgi:hypothetical protein